MLKLTDKEGTLSGKGWDLSAFQGASKTPFTKAGNYIDDYNKKLKEGTFNQKDFVNSIPDKGLRKYIDNLNLGTASLDGYSKSIQNVGIKAKIASVGMNAMAMAGNMAMGALVGVAIGFVVTEITKLVNAQQEAIATANELSQTFAEQQDKLKSNKESIDSISKDYEKLSEGIGSHGENISSTTEQYKQYNDIVTKISEMFPTMVEGYTSEGIAILKNKGNVEALTKAYEEQKKAANDAMIVGGASVWKGFQSAINGKNMFGSADGISSQLKLFKEVLNPNMTRGSYDKASSQMSHATRFGVIEKAGIKLDPLHIADKEYEYKTLTDPKNLAKVNAYYRTLLTTVDTETAKIKPVLIANLDVDSEFSGLDKSLQNNIKSIVNSLDGAFLSQFTTDSDAVNWIKNNIITPLNDPSLAKETQDAFNKLFTLDSTSMNYTDYKKQAEDLFNQLKGVLPKEVLEKIKVLIKYDFVSDDMRAKLKVFESKSGLKNLEDSLTYEEIQIVLNPDFKFNGNSVDGLKSAIQGFVAKNTVVEAKTISDYITSLSSATDNLKSAIQKVTDGQSLSAQEIANLLTLYPELKDNLVETADGYIIESSALEAKKNALIAVQEKELNDGVTDAKKVVETSSLKIAGIDGETNALLKNIVATKAKLLADLALAKSKVSPDPTSRAKLTPRFTKDNETNLGAVNDIQSQIDALNQLETSLNNLENFKVATKIDLKDKSGSGSSSSTENKALNNRLAEIEHYKTLGKYENNELQYIADLEDAKNRYAKTQEEQWSLEEKIYQARKQYEEDYKKSLEDASNKINELVKLRVEMLKKEQELKKQALQDELDGFKKAQDARKEALRTQKDADDYLKNQKEKQTDINKIQKDIDALKLDNSASATKRRYELEEELAKAKVALKEFESDEVLKRQEAQIDAETKAKEDQYDAEITKIQKYLDDQKTLTNQAMIDLNGMNKTMLDSMIEYNKLYGDGITSSITNRWTEAYNALKQYGDLNNVQNSLNNIDNKTATASAPTATSISTPQYTPVNLGSDTLNVGDRVKSISTGNSQASGNGRSAKSGLSDLRIDKVFSGSPYPYRVTRNGTYMGFYTAESLQKYHNGLEGGFVGGKIGNPEFLKLMQTMGSIDNTEQLSILKQQELVVNKKQQDNIMKNLNRTPSLNSFNTNNGGLTIQQGDIIIQGSADDNVLNKLKLFQKETINKTIEKINSSKFTNGFTLNAIKSI